MSSLRSLRRNLNPKKVWLAKQVAEEKIKIARQVVAEQAKKDAQFAADVLKAVGDSLPKEIKEACEESIKAHETIVGGDETYKLTEVVQTDGGGTILVDPNAEVTDGPDSWEPPPPGVLDGPLPPDAQKLVDEHLKTV